MRNPRVCGAASGNAFSRYAQLVSYLAVHFRSDALMKDVAMNVIVPERPIPAEGLPVFYLLHGMGDDYTKWHRNTAIERYAQEHSFVIVMPDGFRGCYTNHHAGPRYFDAIVEDVIGQVERLFPVRRDRGGRVIGGLSMGGYGAMLLALRRPDLFNSAVSHSGALRLGSQKPEDYQGTLGVEEFTRIFGPDPRGSEHDLIALAKAVHASDGPKPHLRLDCGRDDFILHHTRALHAGLDEIGYAHEYAEFEGVHDWAYWDQHVREALVFHEKHLTT